MTPKEDLVMRISGKIQQEYPEVDPTKLASVISLAMEKFEITAKSTDLTIYQGDINTQAFQKFILCKRVQGLSKRSLEYYQATLEWAFREMNVSVMDCTPDHVRLLLAKMEIQRNAKPSHRDNVRRVISSFYTWMRKEGYRLDNPIESIPAIKRYKEKKKAFTDMEIERLRLACRTPKETFIIELLLSTGARVSEISGIQLSDFVSKDQVLVHGKGNKDRYVFLNAKAQVAMENYMNWRRKHFGEKDVNRYLIVSDMKTRNGQLNTEPLKVSGIEIIVREIGKRAGVNNVHPHRFRRTCATWALRRGMPVEQVSLMLGHEKIETTQIYLDIEDDNLLQSHKKYVV